MHTYCFGVFPTIELLTHKPGWVLEVLINKEGSSNTGIQKILNICLRNKIPVAYDDKTILRLSGKENTYAIGIFKKEEGSLETGKNHLLLVHPGDPGNLGTIIRTMVGFGLNNLGVIQPAVDIYHPKTIRSSLGAIFQLNFSFFETFKDYLDRYPNHVYLFATNAHDSIKAVQFEQPATLVFGNESSGLPPEILTSGKSVRIPHKQTIDSLNLSVAVGISLYEFFR